MAQNVAAVCEIFLGVRTSGEVVARAHREAVRDEIGKAKDDDHPLGERCSDDPETTAKVVMIPSFAP